MFEGAAKQLAQESLEADSQGTEATAPRADQVVSGRELYVNASVSGEEDGSLLKPFRKISRALRVALPGDVIRVQKGTYTENLDLKAGQATAGTPEKRITLRGEDMPRIIPAASNAPAIRVQLPHWLIEGFEVDMKGVERSAVSFKGNTEGSTLARCHLHHGRSGSGISTSEGASGVLIENNVIHDFHRKGKDSHGVVVLARSKDITIRGNIIHDTSGDAVQCQVPEEEPNAPPPMNVHIEDNDFHSTVENGVDIKSSINVVILRNRIHGFKGTSTSPGGDAIVIHYSAQDVTIEDNDISDAGRGIVVGGNRERVNPQDPSNITVRNNRIRDMRIHQVPGKRDTDGAGIRVENARDVKLIGNTITNTAGFALIIGRGANHDGAPSENVQVESNNLLTDQLIRLGGRHSRLSMNHNLYAVGLFRSDALNLRTKELAQWRKATRLDLDSTQEPAQAANSDQES